jgi:hypothetical protein
VADPGSRAYGAKLLQAYARPGVAFAFHDKDDLTARIFPIVEDMQRHFSSGKGSYYNDSIFFLSLGLHRILPPEIERVAKLDSTCASRPTRPCCSRSSSASRPTT